MPIPVFLIGEFATPPRGFMPNLGPVPPNLLPHGCECAAHLDVGRQSVGEWFLLVLLLETKRSNATLTKIGFHFLGWWVGSIPRGSFFFNSTTAIPTPPPRFFPDIPSHPGKFSWTIAVHAPPSSFFRLRSSSRKEFLCVFFIYEIKGFLAASLRAERWTPK